MGQHQARVLVIDDEEIIRSLLVESLTAEGFDVESADSGEAAIERLRHRKFDLAITDLKMPGMDGIQTLRALREADRELQVVVMTGYATFETALGALKGGAIDYLQKPFRPTDLTPLLQKAMSRSLLDGLVATYGASRVLIASMGHPDLCRMIVDLAQGVFHADGVALIVRDGSAGELKTHPGGAVPEAPVLSALMDEGERLGRPFCLPSDEDDVRDVLPPGGACRAALVYPLMEEERAFGSICLFRRETSRSFTASELQRGILFASEVSRALTMATLRSQLAGQTEELRRLRGRLRDE